MQDFIADRVINSFNCVYVDGLVVKSELQIMGLCKTSLNFMLDIFCRYTFVSLFAEHSIKQRRLFVRNSRKRTCQKS